MNNKQKKILHLIHVVTLNVEKNTEKEHVINLLHYENNFYLILDLDLLQKHVTTRTKQDKPLLARKKVKHQINSACAILCIDQDLYEFPYEKIKDKEFYIDYVKDDSKEECENLITRFIKHLNDLADIVTTWLRAIDVDKQLRELKLKHWKEFQQAKKCIYCHKTFNFKRKPVFDHSHTHSV